MKNTKYLIPLLIMYVCVMFSAVAHAQRCELDSKFVPGTANNGSTYYTDRYYTITNAGPFSGMEMIKPPNNDKNNTMSIGYMNYEAGYNGYLYVAYDPRATNPPDWLTSLFTQIPCAKIQISNSAQGWMDVYKMAVPFGTCVSLGGNMGPGYVGRIANNYIVLFSSTNVGDQCQPPEAVAPVPQTKQKTTFYPNDDGELMMGVTWPNPRFKTNFKVNNSFLIPDGTVTDNLTGLIWTKDADIVPGMATWTDAMDSCAALADGMSGLTDSSVAGDWRLPNVRELQSLIDYGVSSPAVSDTSGTGPWSAGDPFNNVQSSWYWSATTFVQIVPTFAWNVNFGDGNVDNYFKGFNGYVWCVRGGP